jgi:hypothetical protein
MKNDDLFDPSKNPHVKKGISKFLMLEHSDSIVKHFSEIYPGNENAFQNWLSDTGMNPKLDSIYVEIAKSAQAGNETSMDTLCNQGIQRENSKTHPEWLEVCSVKHSNAVVNTLIHAPWTEDPNWESLVKKYVLGKKEPIPQVNYTRLLSTKNSTKHPEWMETSVKWYCEKGSRERKRIGYNGISTGLCEAWTNDPRWKDWSERIIECSDSTHFSESGGCILRSPIAQENPKLMKVALGKSSTQREATKILFTENWLKNPQWDSLAADLVQSPYLLSEVRQELFVENGYFSRSESTKNKTIADAVFKANADSLCTFGEGGGKSLSDILKYPHWQKYFMEKFSSSEPLSESQVCGHLKK